MKKLILSTLAISTMALMSFMVSSSMESYNVDITKSKVKWTGYHLAKSYEHYGYVTIKSGQLNTSGNTITSGTIVIDMNSITDSDLKKEKDNAKLVRHLKSDDFFNVAKFPESKIEIKGSEKKSGNTYTTTADLTIRGITKEIKFKTEISELSSTELLAKTVLRIPRTEFEVMYGWSLENAMLDGEFELDVEIVANK